MLAILVCAAALTGCSRTSGRLEPLSGVFVYAPGVHKGRIAAFRVDQSTGVLTEIDKKSLYVGDRCWQAAIHPNGHFFYVSCAGSIVPVAIHADGSLTMLKAQAATGGDDRRIAIDRGGRFLYVSEAGPIRLFTIAPDGTLDTKPRTFDGPAVNALVFSPDGKFLYAADAANNALRKYRVDSRDGSLQYEVGTSIHLRDGTASEIVFAPSSDFAYVVHSERPASTITAYRFSKLNGELDYVGSTTVSSKAMGLLVSPTGEFAYVGQATLPTVGIAAYRIGADGTLTELRESPYPTKSSPVRLLTDPSGNYLYATTIGFDLYGYQIDHSSGSLTGVPGFHAGIYAETYAMVCTPQVGTAPAPVVAAAGAPESTPVARRNYETAAPGASRVDRLRDPDRAVRISAAEEITRGAPATHDAIPALIDALRDRDESVAAAAARALGAMGSGHASEVVPALIDAARYGPLPARQAAVNALLYQLEQRTPEVMLIAQQVKDDVGHGVTDRERPAGIAPSSTASIGMLLDKLEKGNYFDRTSAKATLVDMGSRAAPASARLGAMLFNREYWVKKYAMEVLTSIDRDAGEAIPALYGALSDPQLAPAASHLIVRIRHGEGAPPPR